jgi:transcriptional regulator with XRE-family HTH domain
MGTDETSSGRDAFDVDAFYEALDGERRSRAVNWKEVAGEAGVSQSTLTRLGQGRRPDVDSFARLVAWGGLDADRFVRGVRRPSSGGFLTELPAYLRSDPNLDARGVQALEAIISTAYDQFRQSE